MSKYTICNDYDEKSERYWFICEDGEPLYDDDGNKLHFPTYEDAENYVLTLD